MPDKPEQRPIDPRWAWQRYRPSREAPWDVKKAGHLHRRAAFGATLTELDKAMWAGPHRTIDRLLAGGPETHDILATTSDLRSGIRQGNDGNNGSLASAWWLYRMLYSPHPVRE